MHEIRRDRRRDGNRAAHEPARDGDRDGRHAGEHRSDAGDRDQHAARDGAEQNRDERSHLDQAVAADQLLGAQRLRKDRVLHRPEQRRMHAHQQQCREQKQQVVHAEADGTDHHDRDLEELDEADEARLLELVGELPRGRRQQHERQDEEAGGEVDERVGVERRARCRVVRDEDDERVLVDVVVGGAQELRPEERREAALTQKLRIGFAWPWQAARMRDRSHY